MNFDSNQGNGSTAMQTAMESAEQRKKKGTDVMPANNKGGAAKLKVNFPSSTNDTKGKNTGTAPMDVASIAAIMERGEDLDAVLSEIPGQVTEFCDDQGPVRNEIRNKWRKASSNQRDGLTSTLRTLDLKLDVVLNATFGDFTGVERENVQRVTRVVYIGWLVKNCQPSLKAIEWVVRRAEELGVLAKSTKNEKPFVWVGNCQYFLKKEVQKAEEVVAKYTNAEDPYMGIIHPLIKLVTDAKVSHEQHVAGLKETLYEKLTSGATVEDLLAGKGEVMLLLNDPGEGDYQGGQIRVFLKDGLVSPRACMGGNHRKVGELIENGTAIPIAALSDDSWKGDGADEWVLHKILRRAVVNEQDRLERKREGEAKRDATIADAEAKAKVISAAEDVPIISVEELHAGKVGLAVVPYKGAWKTKPSDRKSPKFWHPVMLVQRKGKAKATRKIIVRWVSETAQALLDTENFPVGGDFLEVSAEDRFRKDPYGGVNAPVRQLLQASSRFVKSQTDTDCAETATKSKAKKEAEAD